MLYWATKKESLILKKGETRIEKSLSIIEYNGEWLKTKMLPKMCMIHSVKETVYLSNIGRNLVNSDVAKVLVLHMLYYVQ